MADSEKIKTEQEAGQEFVPEPVPEEWETSPDQGLSEEEVYARRYYALDNVDDSGKTKTIREIVLSNICTLFNFVNIILALAVIAVGSFKNVTFMIIIVCNVAIGIIQEIRSKKTMDRLSFLNASRVRVIRGGQEKEIVSEEVVRDDIMILSAGNQVQADAIILDGSCQVDESFITGEADAIAREKGEQLMAGSYIVNGRCRAQAKAVGADKYVASISSGAKKAKKINSEIMISLQWIVRVISVILVPLGITIFIKQLNLPSATVQNAVVQTTASLIGMIPEGLMLLTSTALAVSVVRLSKSRVMVQQLYCIETLARVDTLCLDKTGTLTEGSMEVVDLVPLAEGAAQWAPEALTAIVSASSDQNATSQAILERYPVSAGTGHGNGVNGAWQCVQYVPFSSKTKWSGASFAEEGTFCMGAAEFLYPQMDAELRAQINEYAQEYRVILLVCSQQSFRDQELPDPETIVPAALVLLRDKIRPEAAPTLAYFAQQGVKIKVISGDSPQTVAGIARHAGVADWDDLVDASTLVNEEMVRAAANEYTVFGRVTPQQKKMLVSAMKAAGHTVAMTGDGVNDVLALRESDCSIAMASGTDAARNAAELVLLDSNFDAMPKVVDEGRRCINNVERSSALFLTKTVYAGLLAILFVFINVAYPFIPIQMSLVSAACIGIPAFLLALQPNHDRVQGHFMRNVVKRALPGGLSVFINIGIILYCSSAFDMNNELVSTLCVIVAGFTGLLTLYRISKPFNLLRAAIFAGMNVIFWVGVFVFHSFLQLRPLDAEMMIFMVLFMSAAYGLLNFIYRIFEDGTANVKRFIAYQKEQSRQRKQKKEAKKEAERIAAERAKRLANRQAAGKKVPDRKEKN